MKNAKRILAIMMAILVMAAALAGCVDKKNPADKTTKSNVSASDPSTSASSTSGETASSAQSTTVTTTTTVATTTATEATTAESTTPTPTTKERVEGRIYYNDYNLLGADGSNVQLSSLAKKYTIVFFWSGQYDICLNQMSVLEGLAKDNEEVSVVMVNAGESKETVEAFAKSRESNLPMFVDEEKQILVDNQVTKLPYLMFLTEELEVLGTIGGKIERNDFDIIFEKLDEFRTQRGDFN